MWVKITTTWTEGAKLYISYSLVKVSSYQYIHNYHIHYHYYLYLLESESLFWDLLIMYGCLIVHFLGRRHTRPHYTTLQLMWEVCTQLVTHRCLFFVSVDINILECIKKVMGYSSETNLIVIQGNKVSFVFFWLVEHYCHSLPVVYVPVMHILG